MAFNGTENFPGKGVLNTLQKHGAIFGKDINAYTSFDETVYNMNNIPVKDGLIDTCLTVLKDWSNYLLLTDVAEDVKNIISGGPVPTHIKPIWPFISFTAFNTLPPEFKKIYGIGFR